jgi:hypothetical protein
MVNASSYAYSNPPAGSHGFAAFLAWQQEETWLFLMLQITTVLFAYAISVRDERDRSGARGETKNR